jgi:hypothetical protein
VPPTGPKDESGTTKRHFRRTLANVLFGLGVCGLFTACSTTPIPPLYTQEEVKASCQRHGGWWRPNLFEGSCEYQGA